MLNFQGTVYIRNGITYSLPLIGGSIFLVNPGSVLIINQQLTAWSTLRFGRRKATVHRTVCAPQQCLKAIEKALTIGLSPTIRAFGRVA